jgi:hypothetical protein
MVVSIGRSSTCVLKDSSERSNRFAGRIGIRYETIIESARVNLSVAFTFKRVTAPFYADGSQPHFTQTGRSPILHKRVTDPFYVNGSQTHFTQTGRRPILHRRVTAPFYADGSQPHFTQTGHRPILREDRLRR